MVELFPHRSHMLHRLLIVVIAVPKIFVLKGGITVFRKMERIINSLAEKQMADFPLNIKLLRIQYTVNIIDGKESS